MDRAVEPHRAVAAEAGQTHEARYLHRVALAARGFLLREMGRREDALRDYEESHGIVNDLLPVDPENAQSRRMLARIHRELGKTLIAPGQPRLAVPRLHESATLLREIRSWSRTVSSSLRDLALSLSWLAVARRESGDSAAEIEGLAAETRQP